MTKQTICWLSQYIIISSMLANNMFPHKICNNINENIVTINCIIKNIENNNNIRPKEYKPLFQKLAKSNNINPQKTEKKQTKKKNNYSKEDLELLSGIIQNEAGSDFCSDYHQQCVASVVLNRTNSDYYPNSIKEVIFQNKPKQYDVQKEFYNPSKRAIKNAKYILENGSILPSNCLFQSEFKQGDGIYDSIDTPISTTYICYKN